MVEMEILIKAFKKLVNQRQLMEKRKKKRIIMIPTMDSASLVNLEHCSCPEETAKHPRRNPPWLLHDGCQILGCCCGC